MTQPDPHKLEAKLRAKLHKLEQEVHKTLNQPVTPTNQPATSTSQPVTPTNQQQKTEQKTVLKSRSTEKAGKFLGLVAVGIFIGWASHPLINYLLAMVVSTNISLAFILLAFAVSGLIWFFMFRDENK